jgi:ATP-dependent Clp protease ATP-binding subunit ClpA
MLNNVIRQVREEHGVVLTLSEAARNTLLNWCAHDLANGGRGIGNRLETTFVNPLARALFQTDLAGRESITVVALRDEEHVYSVELA